MKRWLQSICKGYAGIKKRVLKTAYLIDQQLGGVTMSLIDGKKVIIIGDRDGIPGPAMEACVKPAGADIVFSSTECFV